METTRHFMSHDCVSCLGWSSVTRRYDWFLPIHEPAVSTGPTFPFRKLLRVLSQPGVTANSPGLAVTTHMLLLPFLTARNALEHLGNDKNKSRFFNIFSVSVMQWNPPERQPIVPPFPRSCGAIYSISAGLGCRTCSSYSISTDGTL